MPTDGAPAAFGGAVDGATSAAPSVSGDQQQSVEVELITLRPTGFDPAEITRPAGRVLLAVNNKTGIQEVVFRLSLASGRVLREVRVGRGSRNWRQPITLEPGSYVLTEANHPTWVCRVTITQ